MTNPTAPPPEIKKMTNFPPPPPAAVLHVQSSLSFSSLPDEIVVSLLARIPRSYYRSLCLVSKSFYSLLSSPEMYAVRSGIGATEPRLYICLWLPKPKGHRWFTLMTFPENFVFRLSLNPVSLSSSHAPPRLKSTNVTVGFEIYHIGGTINHQSKAVRVLDCRTHTWRRAPKLTVARKFAKSCFLDGKIYVIGGVEESSMNWGEFFDIKIQTWKPLPNPCDNGVGSDHQVVVFESRLYVITKHNNYAYDPKLGRWLPPDVGLVGLGGPIITGPCCVIENVNFADCGGKFKWYDSTNGVWLMVLNLEKVYLNRGLESLTIHLVNHGGKLVIIWHQWLIYRNRPRVRDGKYKRIMCAVIRLAFLGTQIWGEVEHCNVLMHEVPESYKLSTCLSVSL